MSKELTDSKSIRMVILHLEKSGFTACHDTAESDEFCRYDIKAKWHNSDVIFECKKRKVRHNAYEDAIINDEKMEALEKEVKEGNAKAAYYIAIYEDCFYIFNVDKWSYINRVEHRETTCSSHYNSDRIIRQRMRHYKFEDGIKCLINNELKKKAYNNE